VQTQNVLSAKQLGKTVNGTAIARQFRYPAFRGSSSSENKAMERRSGFPSESVSIRTGLDASLCATVFQEKT
jgi:hypothetical protein